MNQGKRYILYTALALCGATTLAMAATRVYIATVDDTTPTWLRRVISLGLAVEQNDIPVPPNLSTITTPAGLQQLRDFDQIRVEGDFALEIIGASQHKVTLIPASSRTWRLDTAQHKNGLLHITGGSGTAGAVLRLETPMLSSLVVLGSRMMTVDGIEAPELAVVVKNVPRAHLKQNKVTHWNINAESSLEVLIDKPVRGSAPSTYKMTGSGPINIRQGEQPGEQP